jgi:hypothetical protein
MSGQPCGYVFGADSELERFLALDGKIILLGANHYAVPPLR